ncbi:MAG: tetratricopeptide repeat protein [Niabella sp.]
MCRIWLLLALLLSGIVSRAKTPDNYNRALVMDYFQEQAYDKVIDYLKQVTGNRSSRYLLDLGYCYYMQGDNLNAIKAFSEILRMDSVNHAAHLYLAQIYERMRVKGEALDHYLVLTKLSPRQYRYWQSAADLFSQQQEKDSALRYIAKSYELNPASASVTLQYARILQAAKQPDKAMEIVDAFLGHDSTNASIVSKKIELCFKQEDYDAVIDWGAKLPAVYEEAPTAYVHLAYSYLNQKQFEKSLALCDTLIKSNMSSESILYCAAMSHSALKNYVESNRLLDECLNLNLLKDAPLYFRAKATNYENLGQYQQAAKNYDTSYYIFHNSYDLYLAGWLYEQKLNNKAKASDYYKRYLRNTKMASTAADRKIEAYIKEYLAKP